MPTENDASAERERTAQIVAAYLRHHKLSGDQLPSLISEVHQTLGRLGKEPEPFVERTPAVPIRRSVQRDSVVCLECGKTGRTLRRHLTLRHGLSPAEYRARWKLRPEHPLTAPGYSEQRSAMAKQLGLGRAGRSAGATKSTEAGQKAPPARLQRRRRARSKAT